MESPSLEVFKRRVGVMLWDMICSVRWRVGLDGLKGLFQPQWFCDCILTLCFGALFSNCAWKLPYAATPLVFPIGLLHSAARSCFENAQWNITFCGGNTVRVHQFHCLKALDLLTIQYKVNPGWNRTNQPEKYYTASALPWEPKQNRTLEIAS